MVSQWLDECVIVSQGDLLALILQQSVVIFHKVTLSNSFISEGIGHKVNSKCKILKIICVRILFETFLCIYKR